MPQPAVCNQLRLDENYRPRRPDGTVLYRAVARNYKSFEAVAFNEGKSLARHVSKEFEAFLKCGILAHGFLRLKCDGCKAEKLVAFSCKKRGFCSSCGGRRMAESAAHLIDEVFPKVGVRQWVLSFPMPVRFILAKNSKIQTQCLSIVHRAITRFIQKKSVTKIKPGAVTLIQRFGGSLNLNVHYHMLFLEGGFEETKFRWIKSPTDHEIKDLVQVLSYRVMRFLKRKGYFGDEQIEPETNDDLSEIQAASVGSKIALGERRGQRVRRLGSWGYVDSHPELKGPLCAAVSGFSLHAAVYCAPWERDKLEKLCRYITRPAVAEERLEMRSNGDIVMRLKHAYSDGTSHLLFSGLEFVEKLAALIPQPRVHLTRFHGCLAPNAKNRAAIVPKKEEQPEVAPTPKKRSKRYSWAELLARTFQIDILKCDCGGELKIIAGILKGEAIKRILMHLGLPDKPPDIWPSQVGCQLEF